MIVNLNKFKVIAIDQKKRDYTNENIVTNNKQIKNVLSAELLGIQLDNRI